MKPVVTTEQMRAAEAPFLAREHGAPGSDDTLMGRAALAVADAARSMADRGRVLVVAGPGNNGGDGLFAAASLAADHEVLVLLTADSAHEAGLTAALDAGCREVGATEATSLLPDVELVVDAVLGIGGRPGLAREVATLADESLALGVPVLAVDVPSGLAADSGEAPEDSFRADVTVTFAALKPCHVLQPAATRCGRVVVADIGIGTPASDVQALEAADVARWWPVPDHASQKYSRGVVGIDTGSEDYPGAALLSCAGSLHSGPGMVRYLGRAPRELVLGRFPSIVCADGRVQAMVVGSGWGDADAAGRFREACERDVPLVVDADALKLLPADLPAGSVLTPHAGELARLLDVDRATVEADPLGSARRAAARFGATVLLKGATQPVADPDGSILLAVPGPAWTAQAGSGDTLAGVVGTLLAAGLPSQRAAAMAASLQAMTAALHPGPWAPDELASRFPEVIAGFAAL